jgi:hypothetical protein
VQERDLSFIHGLFFREFIVDMFIAFGLEDLVDDFESDCIDLLGVGLPVGEGVAIFGFDDFVENVFVHGGLGWKFIRMKLYFVSRLIYCFQIAIKRV